ncbi:hypothetical protein NQ318_006096 [Aromia moschata]|uniref:Uncharacterized protein n=1 Tax=Aromia moschata TaxID=1265417 RepID=A0AAV8Z1W1_9CUCU|nr:hypothetical protein NQ318_006096 [Aromia moschata]
MYKLVVLFALAAVAAAKPSGIVAAPALAYAQAIPSAVSHQYRSDVIVEQPVVTAYAAPVVQKTVVAAAPVAVPAAVSHSYRTDVISEPVVAAYAAAPAVVAHAPLAYAAHHVPAAVHA